MLATRECILIAVVAVMMIAGAFATIYRIHPPGSVMPEYYLYKNHV